MVIQKKISKSSIEDFITFYHELQIPHNEYFCKKQNRNTKDKFLIISSPSRMGNHLIMSVLDNHPELPRIPGEDGFLSFAFQHANYDYHNLIKNFRSDENIDYIMRLAANGEFDRWGVFNKLYKDNIILKKHAGIGSISYKNTGAFRQVSEFVVQDYEGTSFDIDYKSYLDYLLRNAENIRKARSFNKVLCIYLKAIQLLDYNRKTNRFNMYIAASGMRTQLKWVCNTFDNVKILSSIRSFHSYAISHIRSRYGDCELTDEFVTEAWEHWYHKVTDLLWLQKTYPEKIGLVLFEDLIEEPNQTHEAICNHLGIKYNRAMQQATIYGIPVKGNASKSRENSSAGTFYKPKEFLNNDRIPDDYTVLWDYLQTRKLESGD